jgi:hypothetical protein
MQSRLLIEYLRTGWIAPLKQGDSKELVEAKLGLPEDWKGRVGGFGWAGPLLTDYHGSWAWHYGAICVTFPDSAQQITPGISLDFGFGNSSAPSRFPDPFAELPQSPFTVRELIDLMDRHGVGHQQCRTGCWVSEGGIAICTSDGKYSPDERVIYLFPHSDDEIEASRSRSRQRRIEAYSALLRLTDLPVAERLKWEECVRKLKAEEDMKEK